MGEVQETQLPGVGVRHEFDTHRGDRVGVIVHRDDNVIEIQTEKERIAVEQSAIDETKSTDLSLMPDGLLTTLAPNQIRDLFGYLISTTQVDLPIESE